MSRATCIIQEVCPHFKASNGEGHTDHYVRSRIPCKLFLSGKCEKSLVIAELESWMTGEPLVCDIGKILRVRDSLKEKDEA